MGDPVTTTLAIASIGLTAGGQIMGGQAANAQAQGTATADTYKAEQLEQAAEYGELKAKQTSAQMTRNLVTTLGNIDAVRAANRTDPTSPTGVAVRDYVENTGEEQRNITVNNITQQARTDEANAQYLRYASAQALIGGSNAETGSDIAAVGTLLKGASGMKFGGSPSPGSGGGGGTAP